MRLLITGSRDWEGPLAEHKMKTVLSAALELATALGSKLVLVHGDCPTGADAFVDRWGRRREHEGVTVEPYPADWEQHGKAAGPIRNQEMVEKGADFCVGFLRPPGRGTINTIMAAQGAGIPTFIVDWEDL